MRISINAGHTIKGPGSGAIYKGFNESEINREVVKILKTILRQRGHSVHDSTVDSATTQNAYLRKVCERVNNSDAELFISLHCNASTLHTGHGVECYTWKGAKHAHASKICANLAKLGFRNRGIKDGRNLYVVKNTKPTAILVELFFLDNYEDRKLYLEKGAEQIAAAIAKSI